MKLNKVMLYLIKLGNRKSNKIILDHDFIKSYRRFKDAEEKSKNIVKDLKEKGNEISKLPSDGKGDPGYPVPR